MGSDFIKYPHDFWELLRRIPAFRYLKDPVDEVYQLYERYPDGIENNSFALVSNKNTFYRWDFETKKWEPIGSDSTLIDSVYDIEPHIVQNALGGFEIGDSLKAMTWQEFARKLLIGESIIEVEKIEIQGESSCYVGETSQLTVKITPENASDKSITWNSSNTDIATVSESGLVTAIEFGTSHITAKSKNGIESSLIFYVNKEKVTITTDVNISEAGTVAPSGENKVNYDSSFSVTATANSGYRFVGWEVNEVLHETVNNTWSISRVLTNSTIIAVFVKEETYTITPESGEGYTITPSSSVNVNKGGSTSFTINAKSGYHLTSILVDGIGIELTGNEYTFTNVTSNHTISATAEKEIIGNKMYLGFLKTDDVSNLSEILSNGISAIKGSDVLAAQNISSFDVSTKTLKVSPVNGSILFFAVPDSSSYKVTKDDGFGGHVPFESESENTSLQSNGDKKITIEGISSRVYGEDVNIEGERTIYVELK